MRMQESRNVSKLLLERECWLGLVVQIIKQENVDQMNLINKGADNEGVDVNF